MEEWIKGNFRKSIYQNESGYVIGIFKVKEASSRVLSITLVERLRLLVILVI